MRTNTENNCFSLFNKLKPSVQPNKSIIALVCTTEKTTIRSNCIILVKMHTKDVLFKEPSEWKFNHHKSECIDKASWQLPRHKNLDQIHLPTKSSGKSKERKSLPNFVCSTPLLHEQRAPFMEGNRGIREKRSPHPIRLTQRCLLSCQKSSYICPRSAALPWE